MPLYEVPVYVKCAAPSALEARQAVQESCDSIRQAGFAACVRDPSGDRDGLLGWRSPNADEKGVAGFTTGQPVRLATWSASRAVFMDGDIIEPPGQRLRSVK